jgi:hypothetical protein
MSAPIIYLFTIEAEIIMFGSSLNDVVVWRVGLDDNFSDSCLLIDCEDDPIWQRQTAERQ